MTLCLHKWSNVKRWHDNQKGLYFIIQRCRKCNDWTRKTFDLKSGKMEVLTERFRETTRKTNSQSDNFPDSNDENKKKESDNIENGSNT